MSDPKLYRERKIENYSPICNTILRDRTISIKAKGVYVTVQGLSDNFVFSIKGLTSILLEGRKQIDAAIDELIEHGYVSVCRFKASETTTEYAYMFHDNPIPEEKRTIGDKRKLPVLGTPFCQNREMDTPFCQNGNIPNGNFQNGETKYNNKTNINNNIYSKENNKKKSGEEGEEKTSELETPILKEEEKVAPKEEESKSKSNKFVRPVVEEIRAYIAEKGYSVDAEKFYDFYESKGWVIGKSPMKDWKAAVRTWQRNNYSKNKIDNNNGESRQESRQKIARADEYVTVE